MADTEERERHSRRRKRNIMAKILRDPGEKKGAFALRVINPKKNTYKRTRVDPRNLEDFIENE